MEGYNPRFEMALANPSLPPREEPISYAMVLNTKERVDEKTEVAVN
jgi:hypothetical protein